MLDRWFRKSVSTFVFHHENVLGTSLEIRVRATSSRAAEQAENRALVEIDRLEPIFNSYKADSELRRWQNRPGIAVPVSRELLEVLRAAAHWQERSRNAFNPASEAFTRLWREAADHGCPPSADTIAAVCREVTQKRLWEADLAQGTATCLTNHPLTLNAIAKGYIVDCACDTAFRPQDGIRSVVLNIGGDLRIRHDLSEPQSERLGITDPDRDAENAPPITCIRMQEGAVATSGDWRRGFKIGETFYSHLIDPRTGMPTRAIRSASVFAATALEADVLATICSVLSPEESLALIDTLPGVGCFLIASNGSVYRNQCWRDQEDSAGK